MDYWGVNRSRVNIGMPLFSKPAKAHCSEPRNKVCNNTWKWLARDCPDITEDGIDCDGDHVVSKAMARELGQWIVERGFGGAFPWALNYDNHDNNCNASLVAILAEGMGR